MSFIEFRKGQMNTDTEYCRRQVATYDHDRYILTMACAAKPRAALWAVLAFNHEIAKTREVVAEMHAGHIRLAWWHEALANFAAGQPMPAHDVARPLGDAITTYGLAIDDLNALIDARRFDLDGVTPGSMDGMACYADACNTPLLHLAVAITQGHENAESLKNLGTAYGLCGLIRALPFTAAQKRCTLPAPMLYDIGLMPEQIHHLAPSEKLNAAVKDIVARARTHLDDARPNGTFFKKQKRMTDFYLKRIEAAGFNPYDARVAGPVPFLAFRI